jgi:hypothetical protein
MNAASALTLVRVSSKPRRETGCVTRNDCSLRVLVCRRRVGRSTYSRSRSTRILSSVKKEQGTDSM